MYGNHQDLHSFPTRRSSDLCEEFLENAKQMEKNRTNGEDTLLSGPAREGSALLQGLLLCGHCGRALTVRYTGNGGIYPIDRKSTRLNSSHVAISYAVFCL